MTPRIAGLILAACGALASSAIAHEVRPAYLELRQIGPDSYGVLWKVPALGERMRLGIYVNFPPDVAELSPPVGLYDGEAWIERWRVRRPGGLEGQTITIEGLSETMTDVLVRVERAGGAVQTARLLPHEPGFVVEASPSGWKVSAVYLRLGVAHILLGVDHLVFILALVLLVEGRARLLGAVTSFTIAHSITLAAAALGFVHVPRTPVEACIALSIAFMAAEIVRVRSGSPGLTTRAPWLVAFTFGLLHGLGFAGALSEIGLPAEAITLGLLFFNLGVELGQIAFIATVLVAAAACRRLPLSAPSWGRRLVPYAIGTVGMFWVVQRTALFWGPG